MLANFFQTGAIPPDQLIGSYDLRLVLLSYLVATFASYIALDITGRLRDVGNTSLILSMWVLGGAFAMGAGIWTMHFIGMLAFSLPMPMSYDFFWTGLSFLAAFLASALALFLLTAKVIKLINLLWGGIIIGLGIATMHYMGMQAMKFHVEIHYLPTLFFLSILIAIFASEAALWLALKSNQAIPSMRFRLKFISAFIMGAAICGMHYTGMAAAIFTPLVTMPAHSISALDPGILAITIAAVTFIILGIAFFVSTYKEALNQQLLATAHQAGMAEVAASVLHNVGNVLNSVNVSASLLSEKVSQSRLVELKDLSALINDHEKDLGTFMTNDPRGKHLPEYINKLSDHWKNEQNEIVSEAAILIKNIDHIRDIIAMQQSLSKAKEVEQIVSIKNTLEEAIFITGVDVNHPEVKIEKKYASMKPVVLDKVKLLQILVNLIRNAKDATIDSRNNEKVITIKTSVNKDKFCIQIIDTGAGISKANITRIFAYGFTTKESGHGFGLHSSALAAKEMGGNLNASSEGLGKGAVFSLELPYKTPK